jgi:hypothetical protein
VVVGWVEFPFFLQFHLLVLARALVVSTLPGKTAVKHGKKPAKKFHDKSLDASHAALNKANQQLVEAQAQLDAQLKRALAGFYFSCF